MWKRSASSFLNKLLNRVWTGRSEWIRVYPCLGFTASKLGYSLPHTVYTTLSKTLLEKAKVATKNGSKLVNVFSRRYTVSKWVGPPYCIQPLKNTVRKITGGHHKWHNTYVLVLFPASPPFQHKVLYSTPAREPDDKVVWIKNMGQQQSRDMVIGMGHTFQKKIKETDSKPSHFLS